MFSSNQSINEKRIRNIALSYYSRTDVRKNMLDFGKDREITPRYFEGFGKRPDTFHYESDILELAKKGATSFHCSEEIWKDPLEISTSMTEEQLNNLRKGWDLLIDIDSKYLDYSKIYAEILVKILQQHNIKNIGVKFSGSKGFHLIIPWKAFPKEMSGKKTALMFPEWPRLICKYLGDKISNELKERILDLSPGKEKSKQLEVYCSKCGTIAQEKYSISFTCPSCKTQVQIPGELFERKRKISCSNCLKDLTEFKVKKQSLRKQEFHTCISCNLTSNNDKDNFKERIKTKDIDADIILVSSRHLFRMPYSLHEKTTLASVVIDPNKVKDFDVKDASPLKVKTKNFLPDSEEGEATHLLREAIDHEQPESMDKEPATPATNFGKKKFKEITITNLTPALYPPSIKIMLKGMPSDGRKRALFILLNFFKSLKLSDEEIKTIIQDWNKKNYEPLKEGYIKAQLNWYSKHPPKFPPNYDKPYYKEIGIQPTQSEIKSKNPISYVIRKDFALNKKNAK